MFEHYTNITDMHLSIDGCDDVGEETRLCLIIASKFHQTKDWNEVAEAVSEAASDPEAATPVPLLNAAECESLFHRICKIIDIDQNLDIASKAEKAAHLIRTRRMHQIQMNIRMLDEMTRTLESDEALLQHGSIVNLAAVKQHIEQSKSLFFSTPKDNRYSLPPESSVSVTSVEESAQVLAVETVQNRTPEIATSGSVFMSEQQGSSSVVFNASRSVVATNDLSSEIIVDTGTKGPNEIKPALKSVQAMALAEASSSNPIETQADPTPFTSLDMVVDIGQTICRPSEPGSERPLPEVLAPPSIHKEIIQQETCDKQHHQISIWMHSILSLRVRRSLTTGLALQSFNPVVPQPAPGPLLHPSTASSSARKRGRPSTKSFLVGANSTPLRKKILRDKPGKRKPILGSTGSVSRSVRSILRSRSVINRARKSL